MSKKIYVHIADDHKIVIEGIIAVINTDNDIEVAGYSLTGKQVTKWFSNRKNKADVLILDINIPELDGFEVVNALRKKVRKPKIIVVSSYNEVSIVRELVAMGVNGYITKNNAGAHILNAIKTVIQNEQYYSPDIQKLLLRKLQSKNLPLGDAPDSYLIETLSDREIDVLRMISREYNTQEIADLMNVTTSTIETHRRNLYRKLKVKNAVGLVMYAIKHEII